MASLAAPERGNPRPDMAQRDLAVGMLVGQRRLLVERGLLVHRQPVLAQALLGQRGELGGQLLGRLEGTPGRHREHHTTLILDAAPGTVAQQILTLVGLAPVATGSL